METIPVEAIYREGDKPAWEFVRGRYLQKQLPLVIHGKLQQAFGDVLNTWSDGKGEASSETHMWTLLPGETERKQLVPDVCFYWIARHASLPNWDWEYPTIPPDVTVEVKSKDDRADDIAWKRARYIAWGVTMVVDADPFKRQIDIHGASVYPDLAQLLTARFYEIIGPPK